MNEYSPQSRFMKAFADATQDVDSTVPGLRQLGGVKVLMETELDTGFVLDESEVYLSSIRADVQKQGYGTQAMEMIGRLADQFNVDIVLHASGTDDDSLSDWELRQFYRKFGFVRCGSNGEMVRKANGGENKAHLTLVAV